MTLSFSYLEELLLEKSKRRHEEYATTRSVTPVDTLNLLFLLLNFLFIKLRNDLKLQQQKPFGLHNKV